MRFNLMYQVLTLFFVQLFFANLLVAEEVYFPLNGSLSNESSIELNFSLPEMRSGEKFELATSAVDSMIFDANNKSKSEFFSYLESIEKSSKDGAFISKENIFSNFFNTASFDPVSLVPVGDYVYLYLQYTMKSGKEGPWRENLKCSENECHYVQRAIPADFETVYEIYRQAVESNNFLKQPVGPRISENIEDIGLDAHHGFGVFLNENGDVPEDVAKKFDSNFKTLYKKMQAFSGLSNISDEAEIEQKMQSVMGLGAASLNDQFKVVFWKENTPKVQYTNFLGLVGSVLKLGESPKIHATIAFDESIFFIVSSKENAYELQVLGAAKFDLEIDIHIEQREANILKTTQFMYALSQYFGLKEAR